jgi:hypothetical protein
MTTYSFLDCKATIVGPGGSINLGDGAGAADEGISIEMVEEKNTMQIGADGFGQHSLHAGMASKIRVRILKTSPTNAMLAQQYYLQTSTSALHGQNTITITDVARGDRITCQGVAYARMPALTYAKEAGMNEWEFDCIMTAQILGSGI